MEMPDLDKQVHQAFIEATRLVSSVLPDGTSARVGEWFVYDAAVDNPPFNIAAVEGDPALAASQLADVADWFAGRSTGYRLKLRTERDRPVLSVISDEFRICGPAQPYLSLDLGHRSDPNRHPDLQVERVCDEGGLRDYDVFEEHEGRPAEWSVAGAAMALPECSLWLGRMNGVPVARAMLLVTDPVASIHNVIVYEQYRRRGFGRAVTAAAVDAARAAGARAVSLGASSMGNELYRAMGFELRYYLATFEPIAPE